MTAPPGEQTAFLSGFVTGLTLAAGGSRPDQLEEYLAIAEQAYEAQECPDFAAGAIDAALETGRLAIHPRLRQYAEAVVKRLIEEGRGGPAI